ncbi:MAG TPA: adenylate kinase family protein [Candidatus Bathyarchaeia archaeon]|nr:adenylate kinase family protein [Candidatus Bathyarchaeia archaeon]
MANIILITGTPGVGKTALAKNLSRRLGFKLVEPSYLVKKERLYTRHDRTRRTYVIDERKLRKRLEALSRSSERMVVPTHMVGGFLPKNSVKIALVLRLDPVVLYKRLRARGWTKRKAWENTEAEILDASLQQSRSLLGIRKVFEIDTTGKSAQAIYRETRRALSRGSNGKSGIVNWLARYDPIELERTL